MQKIKNIIFDLGNVILDIDTDLSKEAFKKHKLTDFDKMYTLAAQSEIFDKLEVGEINSAEFYDEFRLLTSSDLNNDIIKECWNALILDYSKDRIDLLKGLKNKYRTFILSNTNIIHYQFYTQLIIDKHNINGLESLVEKAYFSHDVKLKKPDNKIYEFVLNDSNLKAEETLFIDDNRYNIEAAKALGFETILLENTKLEDLEFFRNTL
jgi:putative hydrolase of the HAD superfamily